MEHKSYKDELNLEKINVNQLDLENEIKKIGDDLKDKEDYLSDINVDIVDADKEIIEQVELKDDCLRRLHNIDESIVKIDVDEVKRLIRTSKRDRDELKVQIDDIERDVVLLPKDFDNDNFDRLNALDDKYTAEKAKRDIEIAQLNGLFRQNEDKIKNVDKDIKNEKIKYINYLENNIGGLRVELRETINEINTNSINKRISFENQKNTLKNEISNLKQSGLDEKKNISNYNDMLSGKNQRCPTCNQIIESKDEEHMTGLINESTKKIEDITKLGKLKIDKLNDITDKMTSLETLTNTLIEEKKQEFGEKIKVVQSKIDNFDISLIQDRVSEILKNKEIAGLENQSLASKIDERKKYVEKLEIELKRLNLKISSLKVDKALNEKYKTLTHKRDLLLSEFKDYQRTFELNTKLLDEYVKNENLILENEKIKNDLVSIKEKIDSLTSKKSELLDDKLSYSSEITLSKKVIEDLKDKLERYIIQEKLEELHNVYLKLMHRTGLPTYLLTKNIDILNEELNVLLTNIDFTLFFDEDLNLKLQHDGFDDVINVIESSGYERTISAVVLKMVLRTINFKSKCNIIFLDEIMNKCVGKSVNKFLELLDTMKTKIDKIIIIEQNNEIPSDFIISTKKDENGISSLEVI